MKQYLPLIVLLLPVAAFTQTGVCTVAADSLKGTYEGECKKGVAHGIGTAKGADTYTGQFKKGMPDGEGTYTWHNGMYHAGKWKNGLQDGKGVLHYPDKDSTVMTGYWKKGVYKGLYETPWVIYNLPSYISSKSVQLVDTSRNTVVVKMEGGLGGKAPDISKFTLLGGNYLRYDRREQNKDDVIEFQHVIFPFRIRFEVGGGGFDIEFYEKGNWDVFVKFL